MENSDNGIQYLCEAVQCFNLGELIQAKLRCEKALVNTPCQHLAYGLLGTIEKALGNSDAAAVWFKQTPRINSSLPDILHNYSGLLINSDPGKALLHARKAVLGLSTKLFISREARFYPVEGW